MQGTGEPLVAVPGWGMGHVGGSLVLTLHSQPIWYRWFRLFFWVGVSESQVDTKSQSVMCILPLPSDLPGERPNKPLK